MKTWKREDVQVGDRFVRNGIVYRVGAIADEPTVFLIPTDERDGDDQEVYVIRSPLFGEFDKLARVSPTGAINIGGWDLS